jgi:hypothetical protein
MSDITCRWLHHMHWLHSTRFCAAAVATFVHPLTDNLLSLAYMSAAENVEVYSLCTSLPHSHAPLDVLSLNSVQLDSSKSQSLMGDCKCFFECRPVWLASALGRCLAGRELHWHMPHIFMSRHAAASMHILQHAAESLLHAGAQPCCMKQVAGCLPLVSTTGSSRMRGCHQGKPSG